MSNAVIIIPARLHSTRLPRKMLLAETGQILVAHTYRSASHCTHAQAVFVATGDREVEDAAVDAGCRVVRTGISHECGTSRVWEAASILQRRKLSTLPINHDTIIVNVQGDEPEIDRRDLDLLIDRMELHNQYKIGTLCTALREEVEFDDESVVKVLCDSKPTGRLCWSAAGFSRVASPMAANPKRHIGVYAYRYSALCRLIADSRAFDVPSSPARHPLEQEGWIEAGHPILVVEADHRFRSIDTADDYQQFVSRTRKRFRRFRVSHA